MAQPVPNPSLLDQWFSHDRQAHYIRQIWQKVGITERRARYFVRLWAYLMMKQQFIHHGHPPTQPLDKLTVLEEDVPCSHREAADVFYADSDRGSDRAAGMMIKELVKLKLVARTFDGNISRLQIRPLANIDHGLEQKATTSRPLTTDMFDPRSDAVFAAQLLARYYGWVSGDPHGIAYKFTQALRQWSQGYSQGVRVLRHATPAKVVGVYSLFPAAASSNLHFFSPPSQGLYLLTEHHTDSLAMAQPGDKDCSIIYVRGWAIDTDHFSTTSIQQSLEDMQVTLQSMLQDFPNVCDLYGLSVHPGSEAIAQAVGFQKTVQDSELPVAWLYTPLDQFLSVNIADAIRQVDPTLLKPVPTP